MNILAGFLEGQRAGIANREYRTQQANKSRLSELAPQIMAGDPNAYSQAVAIDPKAAQGYQEAGDAQLRKLQGFIKYVDGARATGNAAAVDAALRQGGSFIQQLTGKAPPTTWTDDMNPGWEDLKARVAMLGSPDGGSSSQNKVVGGALVTPTGEVVYQAPVDTQLVELSVPGGKQKFIYNPRTQEVSPLNSAMRQMMQGGEQYMVGGDLTPEQLALAQADMASGGASDSYNLGQRNVSPQQFASGGQLGFTPDKPEISAAEQIRLDMAREAGARADRAEARADRNEQRQVAANSVSGRTPNEGERNASGFYQRMVAANAELKRLTDAGYDPTNLRDHLTVGSAVGNYLASNEGQQYNQAAMNWVRANLRKESGAAIGVDEARQEIRNYFPQPGDSPEVVQQKAKNRLVVEQAMLQAAGRAAPQRGPAPSNAGGWSIQRIE